MRAAVGPDPGRVSRPQAGPAEPIPPCGGGYRLSRPVKSMPEMAVDLNRFELFGVWERTRGRAGPRGGRPDPGLGAYTMPGVLR